MSEEELEVGYHNFQFLKKVRECFAQMVIPSAEKKIPEENKRWVDRVEFPEKGALTFFKGEKYPLQGYPASDIVLRVDEMKKNIKSLLLGMEGILQNRVMGFLFLLVFRKQIRKTIDFFILSVWRNIANVLAKSERYCKAVREVRRVLDQIKIGEHLRDIIVMILEFDPAYRFRFQFILWYLDKKAFRKNPIKELRRLLLMCEEREKESGMKEKWKMARKFLIFARLNKKKLESFFNLIDISKVVLTEGDRFHASLIKDFNFN